jgi:hypothetical protein
LFAVEAWETLSARPAFQIVGFAVDLANLEPAPVIEQRLLDLLANADGARFAASGSVTVHARQTLETRANHRRQEALTHANETSSALADRRLDRLKQEHHQVVRLLSERLAAARDPEAEGRMAERREQADLTYQSRRQFVEDHRGADIASWRIAEGTIMVNLAQPSV